MKYYSIFENYQEHQCLSGIVDTFSGRFTTAAVLLQGGPHVEIFSAQGKDPAGKWGQSGKVQRVSFSALFLYLSGIFNTISCDDHNIIFKQG